MTDRFSFTLHVKHVSSKSQKSSCQVASETKLHLHQTHKLHISPDIIFLGITQSSWINTIPSKVELNHSPFPSIIVVINDDSTSSWQSSSSLSSSSSSSSLTDQLFHGRERLARLQTWWWCFPKIPVSPFWLEGYLE